MLHFRWFDWVIVGIVPVTALLLGLRSRRKPVSGWVDYFLFRRQMSSAGTVSNYVGANVVFTAIFLVLTLEGSKRGWWVLAVPAAWIVGTILLLVLYPRMAPYLQKGETLHQALGSVFDRGQTGWSTVRRWASLWTIVAFVSGVGLEFYGGVLLLEWAGVPQISRLTLAMALAFVCATFTIAGGLRGIATVNYFLDGATFIGIITLFVFIALAAFGFRVPVVTESAAVVSAAPVAPSLTDNLTFAFGAFFIFVPMQLCALDTWQRGVAWKERKNVAGPLVFGAALVCLAAYIAITAGNYVRTRGLVSQSEHPLLTMIGALAIPSPVIGLVVAGFIATILSTADELLNCCGYAVLSDFLNLPRNENSEETSRHYIRSGKFYTGVFAFVSASLAFAGIRVQKQITDMANVAFATQVVFIMPILFALLSKRARKMHLSALLAMLLAFGVSVIMTAIGWLRGPDSQIVIDSAPLVAFGVGAATMTIGWICSIVSARKSRRHA